MRCPFCYNPTLVISENIKEKNLIPEDEVLAFLKKRKKYLDGVVITGGEPLMQSDLKSFCKKLKRMGYVIKLDTNGLLPSLLQDLILEKLIDYIAMDLKGPVENYSKFCGVDANPQDIADSIKIIKNSGLPYEFRSTLVKSLHKEGDIEAMAGAIRGASLYYLQNFSKQDILVGSDFSGRPFPASELERFKSVAEKSVKKCLIR